MIDETEIYVFAVDMYGELVGRPVIDTTRAQEIIGIKYPRQFRPVKSQATPRDSVIESWKAFKLLGHPEVFPLTQSAMLKAYWVCQQDEIRANYIKDVSGLFVAGTRQ